jgi:hypothetical protein
VSISDYNKGDKALYLSGVKAGEQAERERIHKAFGDYYQHTCSQYFPQREGQMCHLCNMHRLIKGENK